jgi:hypothetical protein
MFFFYNPTIKDQAETWDQSGNLWIKRDQSGNLWIKSLSIYFGKSEKEKAYISYTSE